MDAQLGSILKALPKLKSIAYRQNARINSRQNIAGAIIEVPVENLPESFDYDEIAVAVQRKPIRLGREELVFCALRDAIYLLPRVSHQVSSAILYSDRECGVQLLLGLAGGEYAAGVELLDQVISILFRPDYKPVNRDRAEGCRRQSRDLKSRWSGKASRALAETRLTQSQLGAYTPVTDKKGETLRMSSLESSREEPSQRKTPSTAGLRAAPPLRSPKEVAQMLTPEPEKPWMRPRPAFFVHRNAPSPGMLFAKEDFGAFSRAWSTQRAKRAEYEAERRQIAQRYGTQLQDVEADTRRAEASNRARNEGGADLYLLKVTAEAAWGGLEEFLEQLYWFLEANDLCVSICFNSLRPEALPVLLERCYYLRPQGIAQRFLITEDEGAEAALIYEEKIENDILRKTVTRRRNAFWAIQTLGCHRLDGSDREIASLYGLTRKQIAAVKQGGWEDPPGPKEDPDAETPPEDLPEERQVPPFFVESRGIVFRGTLLHYIEKGFQAVQGVAPGMLVFARPQNQAQQRMLQILADLAEKLPGGAAFCVAGIGDQTVSRKTSYLQGKAVLRPEKGVLNDVALHEGMLCIAPGLTRAEGESWADAVQKLAQK